MTEPAEAEIYEARLNLRIIDYECEPDVISAHLDLEPDRVIRKGKRFLKHKGQEVGNPAKHNVWSISPAIDLPHPRPHVVEMGAVLANLRAILEPRFDAWVTLPPCHVELILYVLPWEVVPTFCFSPADLDFLSKFGPHFDIDIQNFGPDDDDENG